MQNSWLITTKEFSEEEKDIKNSCRDTVHLSWQLAICLWLLVLSTGNQILVTLYEF